VVVLAALGAAYWWFSMRRPGVDSIAVLPLVNTAHDPGTDYLSDGISETVTNDLSEIPGLRVTAWTTASRYRNAAADLQQLGKQFGVKAVLTGRLVHQGDRLVVQAELVNVRDGSHLWGGQYDRPISDLIAVQQQLSHDIASGLRMQLSGAQQQEIARRTATSPQAYELYLKGRFFWNRRSKEGLDKALEYFQQAIAADPNYALAYAGIADCYNLMDDWGSTPPQQTFPKARAAALKALQLDDSLAEAHTSLAMVHEAWEWDWPAAEQEYKRALQLNPNYATARQWYAMFLVAQKRFPEAEAQIQQATQLDPLSPIITMAVGEVYNWEGKYEQAIAEYKKALELNPDFAGAWGNLTDLYQQAHRYPEAMDAEVKSQDLQGNHALAQALRSAYARGGYDALLRVELQDHLRRRAAGEFIDALSIASFYAALGQNDTALEWLRKGYAEHSSGMLYLAVSPDLAALRSDAEFVRLLDTLHLPH
jgi:TolB-like protein/Tfp pilus assembly protein PilF